MTATACFPDTATWDKPVIPVLPDTPTEEQQAAYDKVVNDIALAEEFGWLTLQVLTAGQVAVCDVTVRPCRRSCREGAYYIPGSPTGLPFSPIIVGGQWINVWCTHRGQGCECTSVQEVILPGPVARVTEVEVDGVVLDRDDYYVRDGNKLVRTDGSEWPLCQDMNKKDGVGTFFVTYLQGVEPTPLVNRAAGVLANEMYQLEIGGKCSLPKGTRSVTRQGVTFEIVSDLFAGGATGLRAVDVVVASMNPNGLRKKPRVWSPDLQKATIPTAGRW